MRVPVAPLIGLAKALIDLIPPPDPALRMKRLEARLRRRELRLRHRLGLPPETDTDLYADVGAKPWR